MTTPNAGDDPATVAHALAHAESLLETAEADQAAGRPYTLVEFNQVLDLACQAAVKLPREEFRDVRARLRALLDRLEALRRAIDDAKPAA